MMSEDMTPEQEIAGLKTICQAWAKECKHYQSALGAVRKLAAPYVGQSGILSAIHEFCDEALKHDMQCGVCGDYHEEILPRECETGDGV
jgi:hypothetical protein